VLLLAAGGTLQAHGWLHHHRHHLRHAHSAYADLYSADACRIGWWQTLRYGHIRPRWGAWCR
jgi:hypothetical protein